MSEELERRIQQALDAGRAPEEDAELAAELEAEPEARALAAELQQLDRALRQWPEPARDEPAWEALAERIEGRLDEPLEPMADPTAPPPGDDLGVLEESSGTYERSSRDAAGAPAGPARAEAQAQAARSQPAPTHPPPRRGARPWGLAAAAAAVLGLGVAAASLLGSDGEDEQVALAPAAGEPSTAPAMASDDEAPGEPAAPSRAGDEASRAEQAAADPSASAEAEGVAAEEAEAEEGAADEAAETKAERRRRAARARAAPARHAAGSSTGGGGSAEPKMHQRPSAGGLPASPSEEAVRRAMREVASKVKGCAAETEAVPTVRVTVRGSTGRVRQVTVLGALADTEQGVCIERVVEHVRLPPFERSEHTFTHRFDR